MEIDYESERIKCAIRQAMVLINRESNLVQHAERELKAIGEEQDFIDGYLRILTVFSDMGHSGGSASVFIPTLQRLFNFQNLGPLTNDPEEWMDVTGLTADGEQFWQSKRCADAFSTDGGQTYYVLSDEVREIYATKNKDSE
jgi:hypothetical protein